MSEDRYSDSHLTIECVCESPEHQISFSYIPTYKCANGIYQSPEEMYLSIYLSPVHKFWRRVLNGIKYMFGYRCKWGDFDNVCLDLTRVKEIREIMDRFIKEEETCQTQPKTLAE